MTKIKAIGAIAFGLSASWVIAATLGVPVLEIYFYGRPKTIIDRLRIQWQWNAAAAQRVPLSFCTESGSQAP